MTRFIAATLCIVFSLPAVHAESDASQRPDIVFIIVDDLNDWIGCLGGHPDAKSPNIDALAEEECCFRRPTAMRLSAGLLERACSTARILLIQEPISTPSIPTKRGQ